MAGVPSQRHRLDGGEHPHPRLQLGNLIVAQLGRQRERQVRPLGVVVERIER